MPSHMSVSQRNLASMTLSFSRLDRVCDMFHQNDQSEEVADVRKWGLAFFMLQLTASKYRTETKMYFVCLIIFRFISINQDLYVEAKIAFRSLSC